MSPIDSSAIRASVLECGAEFLSRGKDRTRWATRCLAFILLMAFKGALPCSAATFAETFATSPVAWSAYNGNTAFRWNANDQNLAVTWDSRETNSFFYFPLPFTLTRQDNFTAELTLRLSDIQIGINPAKDDTFQLCFGFLNMKEAKRTNYFRGSGVNPQTGPRSVVEFAYFPDSGFGATVGPIVASTNNQIAYSHSFPVELFTDDNFRIKIAFDAASQTLQTFILRNGEPYGEPPGNTIRPVNYTANFGDFRIDAFSIHSYSDAGQSPPQFSGSLLAHGTVDDITITWPDAPIGQIQLRRADPSWSISFQARAGWIYTLLRASGLAGPWEETTAEPGVDGALELLDSDPLPNQGFYRIRADRP